MMKQFRQLKILGLENTQTMLRAGGCYISSCQGKENKSPSLFKETPISSIFKLILIS